MSKEEKMIGHLKKGNSIKFEKEELEELRKDFDLDAVMKTINHNMDKIYGDHGVLDDPKVDSLLTEELENYYFDQFHESYIELTTGSTDYPKELKNMWNAIRVLYHHYETCSDEPMRDIKNRIIDNYGNDLFDEMDVFKTLHTAMNDISRFTSDYNSSRYLAMLLREYAKGISDSMKTEIASEGSLVYFGSSYATIYITSIIMQYSAILTELHPTVTELDNAIEQMNQVSDPSMLITLVDIDEYLTELEDNDHLFTSEDETMIQYYAAFCSELKGIIQNSPIFTAKNHLMLSNARQQLVVADDNDNNTPIWKLKINEMGDIVVENRDYPIEDVVNDVMKELTKVGSSYSSELVGNDARVILTKDSPEIENIKEIVGTETFAYAVETLKSYYENVDFSDDNIFRSYEFSLIQLKLGTIVDILKYVDTDDHIEFDSPDILNRDVTLYSYYTKLSKLLQDIENIVIELNENDEPLTEFPTDVVLERLTSYYCKDELEKYKLDSVYEYITIMEDYIEPRLNSLNNAYDVNIYHISLSYIEYIKLVLGMVDYPEEEVVSDVEPAPERILDLCYDGNVSVTVKATEYALEDNVNFVIRTLTGTDQAHRTGEIASDDTFKALVYDYSAIEEYTGEYVPELSKTLKSYLKLCKFQDDNLDNSVSFVYSVVELKLAVAIDILDNIENIRTDYNGVDTYTLERDPQLLEHFTTLSNMFNDIECLISPKTEENPEYILEVLEDEYHYGNMLEKYGCGSIKDLLYTIDECISRVLADEEKTGVNPYDVCMCSVMYAYAGFLDATLYGDTVVEEENLDDVEEADIFNDLISYTGAIGHFTNVLTQVMTNRLSLVDPMGMRRGSSDLNYINIMKGLLSIEEDMSVDDGLNVSAFICTMIESIPKSHIYNLRSRVSKHDPESSDYDETLNNVCKETLQDMINIVDKDISEFLKHKSDELGEDMVSKLFMTNMKAYYNIIQVFKESQKFAR